MDDSAIKLYLKVHNINNYEHTDEDMGVPADLDLKSDNDGIDIKEKEKRMENSIYDFIVKMIEGPQ